MSEFFSFSGLKIFLRDLISSRTLIIGEVGSGKTLLTTKIITLFIKNGFEEDVTVIDLAPNKNKIGVPIRHYLKKPDLNRINYFIPEKIYAPRLTASNLAELRKFIYLNYIEAKKLFKVYISNPTKILIVNDLSIFLHYGGVNELLKVIETPETFVANAYYGYVIKDPFQSGLDEMEHEKIKILMNYMYKIISL